MSDVIKDELRKQRVKSLSQGEPGILGTTLLVMSCARRFAVWMELVPLSTSESTVGLTYIGQLRKATTSNLRFPCSLAPLVTELPRTKLLANEKR
jgi:hypothetical protein